LAIETRAAVLTRKDTPLEVREITLAPPGPEEVLVKMETAGLCRSDLNAISGHTRYEMPLVLGHEGVGTVVETGAGVHDLRPGQRVALSWAAVCGRCYFCARGETQLCSSIAWPRGRGLLPDGTTRFKDGGLGKGAKGAKGGKGAKGSGGGEDGGVIFHFNGVSSFSEYTVVYRTGCVKVPDGLGPEEAALAGCPVVTAFGAVFRTAAPYMRGGERALVVGGGNVGRAVVEALRHRGAGMVMLVERERSRWNKNGVDHYAERIDRNEILQLTGGIGVDIAFDCVATGETVRSSLEATRRGGTVVMVGSPHPLQDLTLPAVDFHLEKRLLGSLYGSSNPSLAIPWILGLHEQGLVELDTAEGRSFELQDINAAITALGRKGGRVSINFGNFGNGAVGLERSMQGS